MIGPRPVPRFLGPLLHKAAVDAGFDLEPERDHHTWWRLRSSGARGVAWVRVPPGDAARVWLALPGPASLDALVEAGFPRVAGDAAGDAPGGLALPLGAAGCVFCGSPDDLYAALRHVWAGRERAPERLQARWAAEVAGALAAGGVALASAGVPHGGVPGEAASPLVTEAVAAVRRRVGQGLYRDALLAHWGGRCAVTGLAEPELLRASHAKPWAAATDAERLDVHNGLLLAVHLDALFDRGLLAFDHAGRGVLSAALGAEARAVLGVAGAQLVLRRVEAGLLPYLAWHRAHVFRS